MNDLPDCCNAPDWKYNNTSDQWEVASVNILDSYSFTTWCNSIKHRIWQCKSDRGVSTACNRHLALLPGWLPCQTQVDHLPQCCPERGPEGSNVSTCFIDNLTWTISGTEPTPGPLSAQTSMASLFFQLISILISINIIFY